MRLEKNMSSKKQVALVGLYGGEGCKGAYITNGSGCNNGKGNGGGCSTSTGSGGMC